MLKMKAKYKAKPMQKGFLKSEIKLYVLLCGSFHGASSFAEHFQLLNKIFY